MLMFCTSNVYNSKEASVNALRLLRFPGDKSESCIPEQARVLLNVDCENWNKNEEKNNTNYSINIPHIKVKNNIAHIILHLIINTYWGACGTIIGNGACKKQRH